MNNEKLIELVSEYKFLYDMNDCKYSDSQRKNEAWQEIAEKLHVTGKHIIYLFMRIKLLQRLSVHVVKLDNKKWFQNIVS